MLIQIDPKEREMRNSQVCLGCNKEKQLGTVVCWNCFKYRTDATPLKYFQGTIEEWLKYLKERK